MRRLALLLLLLACICHAQSKELALRPIDRFDARDVSRLHALGKLGAQEQTSLLIEAGDYEFLTQKISISEQYSTLGTLIEQLLRGPEKYRVRQHGALLIVSPLHPAKPLNRILKLQIRDLTFHGDDLSWLDPMLNWYLQMAAGCSPRGYAYGGPALKIGPFDTIIKRGHFEDVAASVAAAQTPTFWLVLPDTPSVSCRSGFDAQWEVGLYAPVERPEVLSTAIGPDLVH
jgi:hypothetical protein